MRKADLIEQVAQSSGIGRRQVAQAVEMLLSLIKEALSRHEQIQLRGFGTFKVVARGERFIMHPASGEKLEVPSRKVPVFLPYKKLKQIVVESLKADFDTDVERCYQQAKTSAECGQFQKAIDGYRSVLARNSRHLEARSSLGLAYEATGEYKKAIEEYKKILEFQPTNVDARYNLGAIYWEAGMLNQAQEEFEKALELAPSSAEAHYNMGVALYKKGLYEKATIELEKAIKIDPESTRGYYYLGASYSHLQMYDKAITVFEHLLKKEPNNKSACWQLGVLYDRKRRPDDAVKMYRKANELLEKEEK